jgi:MFS family permease
MMSTGSVQSAPPDEAPEPPGQAAPPPPGAIERSLRRSIKDASAWAVMQGAAGNHIATFVVLERVGLTYLAAVAAVPFLIGALAQWWAANVTDRAASRNRVIVPTAAAQALVWLPMSAALFLPFDTLGYWLMLAMYVLFIGLGNFAVPPWQSIMGDIVPAATRGRYFGLRSGIAGSVLMASFFLAGQWISYCETHPTFGLLGLTSRNSGFLLLFLLGCAARLISAWYLGRIYEPLYRPRPVDRFTLLDFVRRAPRAHFGRFVFYCTLMHVGIGGLSPFVGWYVMDQLGRPANIFATVATVQFLLAFASQPAWGRLIDQIGSKRVLSIAGLGLMLTPVLMAAARNLPMLIIAQAYDGLLIGAFQIAMQNYMMEAVTPPKRARCAAYHSLFLSTAQAIGAFLAAGAGVLGPALSAPLLDPVAAPFVAMMALSLVFRMLANALFLRSFEDFRFGRPTFEPAPTDACSPIQSREA